MYVIYFRSESLRNKGFGFNQKVSVKGVNQVYTKIYQIKSWYYMRIESASDLRESDFVFVQMANGVFRVWLYAIRVENGKDSLIDKLKKMVGLIG